ncbi:MAG: MBL fold metallo-hydrolase [Parvularculaceae bacterium]
MAIVFALGVATRLPGVQDALFEKAIEKNFLPRAEALWENDGLSIFFCGTGSPLPSKARAQNCTLVFAGGKAFLVDAGTGSWENVQAAGIPAERLAGVFLTHFHSDHIGDLSEVNLGSWVAGRPGPLPVYGPEGVGQVIDGVNMAFAPDNIYRTAHHGKAVAEPRSAGLAANAFDGSAASVVYDQGGLKVTAFPVDHDPVHPAVGYRFDYNGRAVVITGDTAYTHSVIENARGADVLVHEAQANHMVAKLEAGAARAGNARLAKIFSDIPSYHTSPVEAAKAANEAGVKTLVLSHLTPPPDNEIALRIFMRGVVKVRAGVIVAEDGMGIILPADGEETIGQF